jgi:hypothetical protein
VKQRSGLHHSKPPRRHHEHLALQPQRGAVDQPGGEQFSRTSGTRFERTLNLIVGQYADVPGDQPRAEIAVGLQIVGRAADNRGVSGQIDGIGNDGGGGIGLRRGARQHRHRVGDAERETAAMASAGRDTARRIVSVDDDGSHHAMRVRPVGEADGKMLAVAKVQRDVAAVVDIGVMQLRRAQHRAKNLFGDGAGDRGHRRNETIGCERRHRGMHPAGDNALQQASVRIGGCAQQRQFAAEFVEQTGKPPRRGVVGRTLVGIAPARFHDQVDRAILQVKPPAVRQKCDLRSAGHGRDPGADGREVI